MKIKITTEFIEQGISERGGWTRRQLEILGEPWPPVKGWKRRAVGKEITAQEAHEFMGGKAA